MDIASQLVGLLCMFSWVAVERTIWALVAGALAAAIARATFSHVWLPGTANRLRWSSSGFKELISFGKWIFLSSILGFLAGNGDRIMLGGLVDSTTLGVYAIACLIISSLDATLSKIIGDVSFPALSEIARDRPTRLKDAYYQFHVAIASFTYIIAGVLMASGESLIRLLYDPRYQDAGWMVQILATSLVAIPFNIAPQCFMALGMPKILTKIISIRLVTLFILTPVGFSFWGMPGALWGIALSSFASVVPTLYYKFKYRLFDLRKELSLVPLIALGLIMGEGFAHAVDK